MMKPPFRTTLRTLCLALLALAPLAAPRLAAADDYREGRNALQQGRYDDAIKLFEKAASQGSAEGRAGVGLVYLKRRQYDKALENFRAAQKMDKDLAMGVYGEGEVLRAEDHCDQAVPLLKRSVEMDRKFPEAQMALSDCLMKQKHYDEAIASATRGLGWGDKWRPKFLVVLGNIEASRDSLRAAGIYFTKAREEAPDDPFIRRALADFYASRGTYVSAFPEYQAAVALDSTDVELRYQLAQAYYYAKQYSDALDQYHWVVRRDPEFAPGQLALGNLLYLSGKADPRRFHERFDEAKVPLDKYTQLNPSDPKGWSLLGRTEYFLGLRDEALAAMNKAEQLGEKGKDMYTIRARLESEKRPPDFDAALKDYQRGEPEAEDMLRLAQIYELSKNPAAADSIYGIIIAADSTSSNAKFALLQQAKMAFREASRDTAKRFDRTLALFQRRIALDPTSDEAYYYLGLSYKEMKRYPDAIVALRQAVTLADSKADRHFWLGILYAQVDSVALARQELQRSVDLDTTKGPDTGIAYRQLGYYKLLDKKWDEAIPLLEKSVEINPKETQRMVWLAQAYQNSGNRAKALETYDRVLALDPRQPDALKGKKLLQGGGAKPGGTQ